MILNTLGKVSEPKLFYKINEMFPSENVINQGKPDWLLNKYGHKKQSLDIFFPDYNIAIEYQGKQHFKSIKYFGGDKSFFKNAERDERKRLLCLENNCELYYFTYTGKDVPPNWPHKIYSDEKELIDEIRNHIKRL